jgi:hypothetical protein
MFLAIGVWLPDILLYSLRTLASSSDFSSRTPQRRVEAQRERIYVPYLLTYIYPQTADTRAGRSRRKVHACMRAWSMDVKITYHTIHRRAKKEETFKINSEPKYLTIFDPLTCTHSMDGIESNKNSTQVSCLVHDPLGARKDGYKLLPNCSENFSLHSMSYNNPLTLLNPSHP